MTIIARYPGQCTCCQRPVTPGQQIEWERGSKPRHTVCPEAPAQATPAAPAPTAARKARTNSRAGYCSRCRVIVPVGEGTIYRCLGGDSGCMEHYDSEGAWHVDHADRAVCDDVRAKARARQEEAAARALRLRVLMAWVREVGEYPTAPEGEQLQPEGETIHLRDSDSRIYGGGTWAVIGESAIWLVRNNGRDGDDWICNNVRTGGAGAVGLRVAYSAEVAAEVRALAETTR